MYAANSALLMALVCSVSNLALYVSQQFCAGLMELLAVVRSKAVFVYGRGLEEFRNLNYRAPGKLTTNEYNSYQTLNALIEDEVEVGRVTKPAAADV